MTCDEQGAKYITAERKRLKPFAALLFTTSSPRGRRCPIGQMRGQKPAFTLAEVLITLAVIGIVAALTIGVFLPKIHSTIRTRQIATAEVKFTKAMEQMALNNAIGPYYDNTQEFVDELQNYLKISKVCDNEHFEDCFGYDKIKTDDKEIELFEIKNGEALGMNKSFGDTIGIVTIDGTGMILSWNKDCPILEPKVYEWGSNTNETTSCVAMVMDVNLDKSPNTQNKDIALFRANQLGSSCGMKFNVDETKYCWGTPFTPTPITKVECEQLTGLQQGCNYNTDYWAGAYKKCQDEGKKLPTLQQLAKLAVYLYDKESVGQYESISSAISTIKLESLPSEILSNYQSNGNWFYLWSGVERSADESYGRYFGVDFSNFNYKYRYHSNLFLGVCVP